MPRPHPTCLACGAEITGQDPFYSFVHYTTPSPSKNGFANRHQSRILHYCKYHGQQSLMAQRAYFEVNKLEPRPHLGKYDHVRISGIDFHPDEPVFIIRGQDRTAVAAITGYMQLVQAVLGSAHKTVKGVKGFVKELKEWQERNEGLLKEPD